MASNRDIPEVRLSSIKLSNYHSKAKDNGDNKGPSSASQPIINSASNTETLNPLFYDLRRPEAYERMDADKPGEELAHDATIWKLYLEEADDYDQELVKSRQASLDMLLLFAALFSAILTAFLIESKSLLQQDPVDASMALLLMIAQSQQRIELGLPAPEFSGPINLPTFSPQTSARWINGIWFSSLGLSLSAALIAMLGKEWLTAYLSSRPRSAHAHAMLRQSRIEGLERWWALHIIALLPSLLHLSLLLFSIGLVIYLWTLDVAVAAVIAGLIGLTALFYGTTAVLGAIYEFCPYVTQISSYIKAVRDTYRGSHNAKQYNSSSYTSSDDLKALMWLASNARDPSVVDCSYQALAGLRLPTGHPHPSMASSSDAPSKDLSSGGLEDMLLQSGEGTSLYSLFAVVCERFTRLVRNREELSTSGWLNVARYTKGLIGLAGHIQRQGSSALPYTDKPNDDSPDGTDTPIIPLVMEALNASNNLWTESAPPLHADVYTSFVTSELLLLSLALPNKPPSSHAIEVAPYNLAPSQQTRLSLLRSQYSNSLARASTLIWAHIHNRVTIGAIPLSKLLNALHVASTCDSLNPASGHSTHYSQSTAGAFKLIIRVYEYNYTYEAHDVSSGLLGSILLLMQRIRGELDDSGLPVRIAAMRAFASLAPVILQQVYGFNRKELFAGLDYATWPEGAQLSMNNVRYIATRQALFVLRVLGPQLESCYEFCRDALALIRSVLSENDTQMEAAGLAVFHHGADIIPLLECIAASHSAFSLLSGVDSLNIIDMARYPFRARSNFKWDLCVTVLPPKCLPPLIRMIKIAGLDKPTIKELTESVVERMRNLENEDSTNCPVTRADIPCIEYLHQFTHVADGFFALKQAGLGPEMHFEAVTNAIAQITHIAAGRDSRLMVHPIELHTAAVSSFLDNVVLLTKHCVENSGRHQMLLEFIIDSLDLLDVALKDEKSRKLIQEHEAYGKLHNALTTLKDSDTAREILERVGGTIKELGITINGSELGGTVAGTENSPDPKDDESNSEATASDTEAEDDDGSENQSNE